MGVPGTGSEETSPLWGHRQDWSESKVHLLTCTYRKPVIELTYRYSEYLLNLDGLGNIHTGCSQWRHLCHTFRAPFRGRGSPPFIQLEPANPDGRSGKDGNAGELWQQRSGGLRVQASLSQCARMRCFLARYYIILQGPDVFISVAVYYCFKKWQKF